MAFNQSYWFLGSTLGAIVGSNIKFNTAGLEFSLTALFVVLCIEQYRNLKNTTPFIIGAMASVFALVFVPSDKMLVVSISISLLLLFFFKRKLDNE